MATIRKRPAAREDLHEIWSYIAEEDREAADGVVREIHEAYERLAEHPRLGRDRDELAPRIRSLPVSNYVIFYRPLRREEGIDVVRVLHGAQDIGPPMFEGPDPEE